MNQEDYFTTHEAEYREMLIWTAQTLHNAYHPFTDGWEQCPKDVCDSVRRFLAGEYHPNVRVSAQAHYDFWHR